MIQDCILCWGWISEDLEYVEYFFIVITSRSIPSPVSYIDLFKNYMYSVGLRHVI